MKFSSAFLVFSLPAGHLLLLAGLSEAPDTLA